MLCEASEKPLRRALVSPAKGDVLAIEGQQAMVADGHAMGVAAQITEDLGRSSESRFGIDDPILFEKGAKKGGKLLRFLQLHRRSTERKTVAAIRLSQSVDKLASKDAAEHLDWEKEVRAGPNPLCVIWGEPSVGNQAVDMRVQT